MPACLIDNEFEVKAKDDKRDLVTNFDYKIEKFIIPILEKSNIMCYNFTKIFKKGD